jgi:hypothetical protein
MARRRPLEKTLVGELGLEALVPGRVDTAVDLRGASALALAETPRLWPNVRPSLG